VQKATVYCRHLPNTHAFVHIGTYKPYAHVISGFLRIMSKDRKTLHVPELIHADSLILLLVALRPTMWLRHWAASQKVAGSIPDGVSGFFHCHNPSGRTMTLGSTQPLTEMSTRNVSWG